MIRKSRLDHPLIARYLSRGETNVARCVFIEGGMVHHYGLRDRYNTTCTNLLAIVLLQVLLLRETYRLVRAPTSRPCLASYS